ncbi:MAG: hypothetical protein ABIS27_00090 [Longimicrobiales bacterium]
MRRIDVRAIAIGGTTGVLVAVSILILACHPGQPVVLGSAHRLPAPEQLIVKAPPLPANASADTTTAMSMQNVLFHLDDDALMSVRHLRGAMRDLTGSHILDLDDKKSLEIVMDDAEIALSANALSIVLNRYIFGYKGAPLKNLVIRTEGDHIVQTGTMHKIIDIPFEMTATLSVDNGRIRIHPTKIEICNLDGEKLLRAVGSDLEKLLDLSGAKGVSVQRNDLLIDPLASLPAPRITGRLASIRVEAGDIIQTFGAPGGAAPTPSEQAPNYIYFFGGTMRLGKLFMVHADLQVIDGDPSDPFEFYLDYYNTQLIAGYHVTTPKLGLIAYMPDFDDIGTAKGIIRP